MLSSAKCIEVYPITFEFLGLVASFSLVMRDVQLETPTSSLLPLL